jgi:dihydrofolate reductase
MLGPYRIEGYAIVSAEGMIADAQGAMPDSLKNAADQEFFSRGLDDADLVVHGRFSHEGHANSPRRKRLVATRGIATLAPDPSNANALLWNPQGASLAAASRALGLAEGVVAIIGGTEVFTQFLDLGYDEFHLSRASRAHLAPGRPVFRGVPEVTPENLLTAHGLSPGPERVLDAAAGVTLVTWTKRS